MLAFLAKMVTADPLNAEREFIISFYLADDSITVTERPQKKSGKSSHTSSRTVPKEFLRFTLHPKKFRKQLNYKCLARVY